MFFKFPPVIVTGNDNKSFINNKIVDPVTQDLVSVYFYLSVPVTYEPG